MFTSILARAHAAGPLAMTAAAVQFAGGCRQGQAEPVSVPSYESREADTAGLGERRRVLLGRGGAYAQITPQRVARPLRQFPFVLPTEGPEALQIQILLDRANFSPGIIDGTWGANARTALRWFKISYRLDTTAVGFAPVLPGTVTDTARPERRRERRVDTMIVRTPQRTALDTAAVSEFAAETTAVIDRATYERLLAVSTKLPYIARYTVSADDVDGPFVNIPGSVYQQARLRCMCYESVSELLAERFHTTRALLEQLNPGVNFDTIASGTAIWVPNVFGDVRPPVGPVAKIVISKREFFTQARDSNERIVHHFPSTLGAGYDPSPTGDYRVIKAVPNPTFHYQPKLFAEVPDTRPTAKLRPGPNSPVGLVWIALSKAHYGIHGTSAPETIGYANSHGCVRLANWDALQLANEVRPGVAVQFR
jgi:lipoprotein-anchoring transpeptidase ErfK/SrfK